MTTEGRGFRHNWPRLGSNGGRAWVAGACMGVMGIASFLAGAGLLSYGDMPLLVSVFPFVGGVALLGLAVETVRTTAPLPPRFPDTAIAGLPAADQRDFQMLLTTLNARLGEAITRATAELQARIVGQMSASDAELRTRFEVLAQRMQEGAVAPLGTLQQNSSKLIGLAETASVQLDRIDAGVEQVMSAVVVKPLVTQEVFNAEKARCEQLIPTFQAAYGKEEAAHFAGMAAFWYAGCTVLPVELLHRGTDASTLSNTPDWGVYAQRLSLFRELFDSASVALSERSYQEGLRRARETSQDIEEAYHTARAIWSKMAEDVLRPLPSRDTEEEMNLSQEMRALSSSLPPEVYRLVAPNSFQILEHHLKPNADAGAAHAWMLTTQALAAYVRTCYAR